MYFLARCALFISLQAMYLASSNHTLTLKLATANDTTYVFDRLRGSVTLIPMVPFLWPLGCTFCAARPPDDGVHYASAFVWLACRVQLGLTSAG
jgi:hypothetical protein